MRDGFLTRRLVRPILELLRQGVTPEKLALSVALGVAVGVLPALGWTTLLCTILAVLLRLNLPAIQTVNYFVYPAQVGLLIPFFRLGERLFRAPHLPISVSQIQALLRTSVWGAIQLLWTTTWHAIVVWAFVSPVFALAAYAALLPLLRRVLQRQATQPSEAV